MAATFTQKHTLNLEQSFQEVEKLLYDLAWKYTRRYMIPFDDTKREVYWGFVKCYEQYDPARRASFSTACYFIAEMKLRTLVIHRTNEKPCDELNEETASFAPSERSECMEMIEDLSTDAQELVRLLVETPKEIIGWAHEWNPQVRPVSPMQLLKRVKKYLVEKGRQKETLEAAEMEIRQRFQQVWAA